MITSLTVPDLLETTRSAIKKVLKAKKVDFLLMDRELVAQYKDFHG
jgi:hypothetical protein